MDSGLDVKASPVAPVTGNFPPLKISPPPPPPGGEDFLGNFPPTLKIYPPGGKFS